MRKEFRIDFRCTEDEFFAINSTAKDCGLTKSDYVRKVILGFRPWKRLSEEELLLLQDIRKATADLQHIHNLFHQGSYTALMKELQAIVNQLKSLLYDSNRKKH